MKIPGNFMRGIVDRFRNWKKPKDAEAAPKGAEAPKDSYVNDSGESRGAHHSLGNEAVRGLSEPRASASALSPHGPHGAAGDTERMEINLILINTDGGF